MMVVPQRPEIPPETSVVVVEVEVGTGGKGVMARQVPALLVVEVVEVEVSLLLEVTLREPQPEAPVAKVEEQEVMAGMVQ